MHKQVQDLQKICSLLECLPPVYVCNLKDSMAKKGKEDKLLREYNEKKKKSYK
jgi:hypothetical protein